MSQDDFNDAVNARRDRRTGEEDTLTKWFTSHAPLADLLDSMTGQKSKAFAFRDTMTFEPPVDETMQSEYVPARAVRIIELMTGAKVLKTASISVDLDGRFTLLTDDVEKAGGTAKNALFTGLQGWINDCSVAHPDLNLKANLTRAQAEPVAVAKSRGRAAAARSGGKAAASAPPKPGKAA